MRSKDKLRFLLAKILFRETILFSKKDGWEWPIRDTLKSYVPFFYKFHDVNLNQFDLVVPLTILAEKYINDHSELFIKQKAVVPSNACIDLCNDKERFNHFLVKNGFGQFVPKINQNFDYPYVLKKKIGAWGIGISIITDSQSEHAHRSEIESEGYFTEEYLDGKEEFAAHIIFGEKRILFFKALKYTFQDQYFVKGQGFKQTSLVEVDHSHCKNIFKEILTKLNYQGICCFNYKLINNELKIFEINPRYGASLYRFINEALVPYRELVGS